MHTRVVLAGVTIVAILMGSAVSADTGAASRAAVPMVRLQGHIHPWTQTQADMGEAPESLPMPELELLLAKTPAQTQALTELVNAQQDPKNAQYHQWLTPAQYGARFGASAATVAALTHWLAGYGLTVDPIAANRSTLHFHGSKSQVEGAFQTQIHLYQLNGVRHYANVSAPAVPAALASQITAVGGLHNFYPISTLHKRSARSAAVTPQISYQGGDINAVGPGDFAVMYNLQPLYQTTGTGSGITIAIAGESDIDLSVATTFWVGVGLTPAHFNSITVPQGQDPGKTNDGNEDEAYLDVEIAGGLAQGADILLVRDANALNAAEYVIQQNLAPILNISFGSCESDLGSGNSFVNSLFQEADTQGITVTVSSGDAGVAACSSDVDVQGSFATSGVAVNGLASTPYALAVGGTEFNPTQPQAWSTSNTYGSLVSAQAHIPEMAWNDTCANPIWVEALKSSSASVLCNTADWQGAPSPFLEVLGGGGGLSSCISTSGGACQGGYAQPSWQSGVAGIGSYGTRAIPDVALVAVNWVVCSYDTNPCDPATQGVDFAVGTSASAPAMAAILAILDQSMISASSPDGRQGLINPLLYRLAAAEYGTPQAISSAIGTCSANLGASIGSGCVFYNVVAGNNDMPCTVASYNDSGSLPASTCVAASGEPTGIMEVKGSPQYSAGTGFNLATGLGSINATNLVLGIYLPAPSGLTAQSSGTSIELSWSAETHSSGYSVYQGSASGQEGSAPVQSDVQGTSATISGLAPGQTYYFKIAAASTLGTSAQSSEVQASIAPPAPTGLSAKAGNAVATLSWTAATGASSYAIYQSTSAGGEGATAVRTGVTGTATTVSNLTNGTAYYFKIAAINSGGSSPLSAEANATPTAPSGGGGSLGLELLLLSLLTGARVSSGARPSAARKSERLS